MDQRWSYFAAEARELIAAADRRLARAGATKTLGVARDRLVRNLEGEEATGRHSPDEIAHWRNELRDQLSRDLVRAEPTARRERLGNRRVQPGMRVHFSPPGQLPVTGVVFQVVGTRAKIAPDDGSRPWSFPIDEVDIRD